MSDSVELWPGSKKVALKARAIVGANTGGKLAKQPRSWLS